MSAAMEATEEERQTVHGLARFAYEYIDAAMLVDKKHGARKRHEFISPVPAYFAKGST